MNDDAGQDANESTMDHNGPAAVTAETNGNGNGAEPAAAAVPLMMSSFFPSPPSYIAHFSPSNVALARRLIASTSFSYEAYREAFSPAEWKKKQASLLEELGVDQDARDTVKDIDLVSLVKPPDAGLIEEDGHWMSFGQAWPIREELPSLEAMGVKQLYATPHNFEGRRRALHSLLHTLLHTYLKLLTILVQGPPSIVAEEAAFHAAPHDPAALKTQSDSAIEHIRLAAINIHHLCNEWRPIQARETMKLMMRNQIEDRTERIAEMRSATQAIRARLDGLETRSIRQDTASLVNNVEEMTIGSEAVTDQRPEAAGPPDPKADAQRKLRAAIAAIGE